MRFGAIAVAAEALPGGTTPQATSAEQDSASVSNRLGRAPRPVFSCGMVRLPMLRGYDPQRVLPGTLHMSGGDFGGAFFVAGSHGIDEFAMLLPRQRPFVEPQHVDPGEQAQPVVDLQQRLTDEAVAAFARDHFVYAESELNLSPELVGAWPFLSLEHGKLTDDVLELADTLGRNQPSGRAHGVHLEQLAEFVDLVDRLWLEFWSEIPHAGLVDGKAVPL